MPKGVICGGAVDGSNQVGAIVTCQATITSPAGAVWAAAFCGNEPGYQGGGERSERDCGGLWAA